MSHVIGLVKTLSNGSEPRIDNFLRRESSNFKDVEATARALQRTVVTTSENVKSLLNLYNMLSTDRINKVPEHCRVPQLAWFHRKCLGPVRADVGDNFGDTSSIFVEVS